MRNPIAALLQLLANHLIVLTLAGFVVVGLWLAGLISFPKHLELARPVPETAPNSATPVGDSPSEQPPAEEVPAGQMRPPVQDEPPAPVKPPPLIGGTLPNYQARATTAKPPPVTETPSAERAPTDSAPADSSVVNSPVFRPPETDDATMPAAAASSREQLLQDARRAYWNEDLDAAESAYVKLVSAFPEDGDAYVELGNVYRAMGRKELANNAYYEAAIRLKAAGEQQKVQALKALLGEAGDARAQQLDK